MSIVGHIGGSHNLTAVMADFKALKGDPSPFTNEQLVRIISTKGGSHNLAAVTAYFKALKGDPSPFTNEQLVRIVGHDGGSHNLAAVQKYSDLLFNKFKFNPQQVTQLIVHYRSKNILTWLEENAQLLGEDNNIIFAYIISPEKKSKRISTASASSSQSHLLLQTTPLFTRKRPLENDSEACAEEPALKYSKVATHFSSVDDLHNSEPDFMQQIYNDASSGDSFFYAFTSVFDNMPSNVSNEDTMLHADVPHDDSSMD